jgi:probable rRNA maturation factor
MSDEVEIAVRVLERRWRTQLPAATATARRAARAALALGMPTWLRRAARRHAVELNLVLAADATVRDLNREFRKLDKPTNVLSFGAGAAAPRAGAGAPILLGDVVLARETVAAEAAAQGKSMADHTRHLVVHGVLHLLGFDHVRAADARRMEAVEISVLSKMGVTNPYRSPPRRAARTRARKSRP